MLISGFQKNEFDKAIADLGQSIRLDPARRGYVPLPCKLVWRARQKYDKAISDCTSAIQLNPDDADSYSLSASDWRYKQQCAKVIADCTAAIQLKPDNAYVFELRADAWSRKQEFDKVIADLHRGDSRRSQESHVLPQPRWNLVVET